MFGTPAGAGTQKDFSITQQFDFPTVYGKKARLAQAKIEQNTFVQKNAEQEILLEAKKLLI
ncbi:MAG: TolC family protein, partial [Thermoanaerobaculia bacterium]